MAAEGRGSRDYPATVLPPLAPLGVTRIAKDVTDGVLKESSDGAAYVPFGSGGGVLQTVSANLAADITTTANAGIGVYTTLLTAPAMVTAAGRIRIDFYAAWNHGGPNVGNVAANFRFRLNGFLLAASRGTTSNQVRGRIAGAPFNRVIAVPAAAQTVIVEWGGFGLLGNSLQILATAAPDLFGAQLIVQELPP